MFRYGPKDKPVNIHVVNVDKYLSIVAYLAYLRWLGTNEAIWYKSPNGIIRII